MATKNKIDRLIDLVARLPGLGQRSARRMVLYLLRYKENIMLPLADVMHIVAESIKTCTICGNLDEVSPCQICTDCERDHGLICIVETIADLWAIERSDIFRGSYHILGNTLSARTNKSPESLNIPVLLQRIENGGVHEIIIATNATLDGQTTAYYLLEKLKQYNIKVSRLAHGIPLGGELDYLDEGTLNAALSLRQVL
jgi:recombination protein RecR